MGYLLSRDPWLLYVPVPAIFVRLSALIRRPRPLHPTRHTVRLALISDIHSNLPALEAVLVDLQKENQTLYSAWVMWWDMEQIHWRV